MKMDGLLKYARPRASTAGLRNVTRLRFFTQRYVAVPYVVHCEYLLHIVCVLLYSLYSWYILCKYCEWEK